MCRLLALGGLSHIVGSMRPSTRCRLSVGTTLVAIAAFLIVPATGAACGESEPPQIKSADVSPSTLAWEGGTIILTTEVESDCGLEIYAEVGTTEGLRWSFQMLGTGDPNSDLRTY